MKTGTILLIEDNPSDIALTRRALTKARISNEVVAIEDGEEALEYLFATGRYAGRDVEQLPALTLLDLKLPGVPGIEILRQIRADPRTHRMCVVVLTTSGEVQDVGSCYEHGVNSYIRKPVDFLQFAKVIEDLGLYWLVLNEAPPPPLL